MKPSPDRRRQKPVIDIQMQSPLWKREAAAEKTVRGAIETAASMLSTPGGEVSILLTDDSGIRLLNRDWRGIDKATNVLSFPAAKTRAKAAPVTLGDIVIAFETLKRECADENRAFLHHLAHLAVHGYLHLIGYDHDTDAQAGKMEGLESRIMSAMKMPDPYLARDTRGA
jgi:probable rRNA maturation factor